MPVRAGKITLNLILMGGITALIGLCIVYPFLPGGYDRLAVSISTMAQVAGIVGLLLVPVDVLWLFYEFWRQARNKQHLPIKGGGYFFAVATVLLASVVTIAVAIVGAASIGLSSGLLILTSWFYIVSTLIPKMKLLKSPEQVNFNFIPLYLTFIPLAVLLGQLTFAAPVTQFSRDHAIAMSAELINDIEAYHARYGRYPDSLLTVWNDYFPAVVGIEQFHYAPAGDAYNLFFEQPAFLLDNIGAREFVVYNPLDEQVMISHNSWILILGPETVRRNQGWFTVRASSSPHWKSFWFD